MPLDSDRRGSDWSEGRRGAEGGGRERERQPASVDWPASSCHWHSHPDCDESLLGREDATPEPGSDSSHRAEEEEGLLPNHPPLLPCCRC